MNPFTNEQSFTQQSEELKNRVNHLDSNELPTANIIVAGITGTGKSTLINAVFGKEMAKTGTGRPITAHIDDYATPDIPIRIWDTVGLELDSDKTEKSIRDIRETIANKTSSKDPFDRIHAIWYCISASGNRYQGAELNFIKSLHSLKVPFIIVMTKCIDEERDNEFERIVREINEQNGMGDIEVIQVIAQDYKTRLGTIESFGLEQLVKTTTDKLPEFIKSGFVAAQRIDVVNKRIESEKIIVEYIAAAKKGFWDKVMVVNIFTTDKKVRNMTSKIGALYNTVLKEENVEEIINRSGFELKDAFSGLFFDGKFKQKVENLLGELSNEEGFSATNQEFEKSERAARMVAFYGYTFVISMEELWNEFTEAELKDVNLVVDRLSTILNDKLKEMRRNRDGK